MDHTRNSKMFMFVNGSNPFKAPHATLYSPQTSHAFCSQTHVHRVSSNRSRSQAATHSLVMRHSESNTNGNQDSNCVSSAPSSSRFDWSSRLGSIIGGSLLAASICTSISQTQLPSLSLVPTAQAGSKYSQKSAHEKVAQIAVFAVTNASGQPYLANTDGVNQVGLIYFSVDDAAKMQADMLKNPSTSDAKIFSMTLDKAFDMVRSPPQPSGIRGPNGKELSMVFRFFPCSESVRHANDPLKKLKMGLKQFEGVPVFTAKGLTIRKGGETLKPVFFSMEDLLTAWNRLRSTSPNVPARPAVEVEDFLRLFELMETNEDELNKIALVPSTKSVEFIKQMKSGPQGTARMHMNPNNSD